MNYGRKHLGSILTAVVLIGMGSGVAFAGDAPSTLTLESARAGLALASGSAEDYVDLAELAWVFGDVATARRFEQFARAKAATEGGPAENLVDAALAPRPRRGRADYQAFLEKRRSKGKDAPEAKTGKRMADPREWIGVILKDMEKAGLENEAIRFALRNRDLAPAYIDPRLGKIRDVWEKRLEKYVRDHPTSDGSPPVLFNQPLTPPYATFATGERRL